MKKILNILLVLTLVCSLSFGTVCTSNAKKVIKPKKMTLNVGKKVSVGIGGTRMIKAKKTKPAKANKNVILKSSNPKVVKTNYCYLAGLKPGKAVIKVCSAVNKKCIKKFTVIVKSFYEIPNMKYYVPLGTKKNPQQPGTYTNQTFTNEVTITGGNGAMNFYGCTFKKGIIVKASKGAVINIGYSYNQTTSKYMASISYGNLSVVNNLKYPQLSKAAPRIILNQMDGNTSQGLSYKQTFPNIDLSKTSSALLLVPGLMGENKVKINNKEYTSSYQSPTLYLKNYGQGIAMSPTTGSATTGVFPSEAYNTQNWSSFVFDKYTVGNTTKDVIACY